MRSLLSPWVGLALRQPRRSTRYAWAQVCSRGANRGDRVAAVDSLVEGPAHGRLRQKCRAPGEGGGTRPRTKHPRPAGQEPPSQ